MCKDVKTHEIFRADHLVEAVLEARIKGDQEARGQASAEPLAPPTGTPAEIAAEEKKRKKKKNIKSSAIKLEDAVVKEYEYMLAQIDNYTGKDLGEIIRKHQIVNPTTANELTEPVEFNLMFASDIGPTGQIKGCVGVLSRRLVPGLPLAPAATSAPRLPRATSSTLGGCSTSITAGCRLLLPRSAGVSGTKSPPSRVCCVSGGYWRIQVSGRR